MYVSIVLSNLGGFNDEETEGVEEEVGVRGQSLHVANVQTVVLEDVGEFVFVGDLTKVNRGEVLKVGLDLAS